MAAPKGFELPPSEQLTGSVQVLVCRLVPQERVWNRCIVLRPRTVEMAALLSTEVGGAAFKDRRMAKPAQIDIVRRAYQLWQQAGEPAGRDQEFYLQAERELQEAEERGDPAKQNRDDS
jgi:Protein of unknown function (DUF2934)